MWYNGKELQDLKEDAYLLIQDVRSKQDPTNRIAFSAVIKRSYDACMNNSVPTSSDMRLLVRWNKVCPTRRGLERFYIPALGEHVKERRLKAIQAILEIQRRSSRMTPEQRAERLNKAAVKLSKASTTFARVMGIADAAVAKEAETRLDDETFGEMNNILPVKKPPTLSLIDQSAVIYQELSLAVEPCGLNSLSRTHAIHT